MKCPNCGYDNHEKALSCQVCGATLAAADLADPLSVGVVPDTLWLGQAREITLRITNRSRHTWKDIRFSLKDLRVVVSSPEVGRAELLPSQTWIQQLAIEVVSNLTQLQIPFQLSWRNEAGGAERYRSTLAFAVKPPPKSPSGKRLHMMGPTYALIVGVGDYTHHSLASLPATIRDAQAVAAVLTDSTLCGYPPANVQVVVSQDATAANIRAALKSLAQSTNAQTTMFIYFSGHGGRALESGTWRTYLCPCEADPDDLAHTAIPGEEFSALLTAIPAHKLLVVLDACHAAGSAHLKAANGASLWKAGLPDDYYEALSQGSGRIVIASSKEGQVSYVRHQGDLSLFTHHLLQALSGQAAVRGDGLIRVLDVFHYVNEAVQADEPRQTPILKAKDVDQNFPIALARAGKGNGPTLAVPSMAAIREQIVRAPISGAKALGEYLAAQPEWAAKRNEVDLKRTELERIQHDLDLFGPNPSDQAAENRVVYFLLHVCLELEQST